MQETIQYWHAMSIEKTLEALGSSEHGLKSEEAESRINKYGFNKIVIEHRFSMLRRLINQFNNMLIWILLLTAMITFYLQYWIDTSVIVAVVILSVMMGFYQEAKAEKAIEALKKMLTLKALVIRSGKHKIILAEKLVPGDIIILKSGDKVPADARLIKAINLQTQESILTGESLPVEKEIKDVLKNASLAERHSMVYSGTYVVEGAGLAVVTGTGVNTEVGRISQMLKKTHKITTPLLQQFNVFSQQLAIVILFATIAIFWFGVYVRHLSVEDMLLAAVAIAVSAIPEGLPALMTIIFSVGVMRMAERNVIVKSLPAAETLSSVTVICTDKTGTLTKNELTAQQIITASNEYEVSGTGYNDAGVIKHKNSNVDLGLDVDLNMLLRAVILCNEAQLYKENNSWHALGNPVDCALLALAYKAKIDEIIQMDNYQKIDFIPFSSKHKYMASLYHNDKGETYVFVKGAPEKLLSMSSMQLVNGQIKPVDKEFWHSNINSLAAKGGRVIAVAYLKIESAISKLKTADFECNLRFIGVIGIEDALRDGAKEAVLKCQQANINIKMVTGDHSCTAIAIGKEIGLRTDCVIQGDQIDQLDDKDLQKFVESVDVYARTTPGHKLRLLAALRKNNHITAMTGDGVNDAPALLFADIGIAMGKRGTDVAREAAGIVLADDNFVSIVQAVKEARTVYDNLRKIILFILPTNASEAMAIFIAVLLGMTLPITPLQVLWVNLVTSVTLGFSLAFERAEKNIMQRKPRIFDESLLSRFLLWRIIFVACLFLFGVFALFEYQKRMGVSIEAARTVVVNVLVFSEAFYLLNCQKIYDAAILKVDFLSNKVLLVSILLVILLQIFFTYLPVFQFFFSSASIGFFDWVLITLIGVVIFLIVEAEKWFIRKFFD